MTTLAQDARYQALARRAALRLGTRSAAIVNAILAQWSCELGNADAYPPHRNNPGNLARGAARAIGVPFTVAAGPNPQPGNPIVTFASPEAGADAYSKLLATLSRYAPVRTAVTRHDGRAYLRAISAAGYGTGLTCMLGAYRDPPAPAPAPLPSTWAPASMGTPPAAATVALVVARGTYRVYTVSGGKITGFTDRPTAPVAIWASSWATYPWPAKGSQRILVRLLSSGWSGGYVSPSQSGVRAYRKGASS